MRWIPLHVRSQYSILSSSASVEALVDKASQWGMRACALTDLGNLFGAVEFYKACQGRGIQPILGCEIAVAPQSRFEKTRLQGHASGYPIVLLVKNKIGYRNLCKLSSIGYLEGFYYTPRIDKEVLKEHAEGLICLSGSQTGMIASLIAQGKEEELEREALWYKETFQGDYYFEIQRHPIDPQKIESCRIQEESWLYQKMEDFVRKEQEIEKKLLELHVRLNIPIVATNDSKYLDEEDWKAHEILINILSGEPSEIVEVDSKGNFKQRIPNPRRDVEPTLECFFKSPEEMGKLFADLPEALENTVKIAGECSQDLLDFTSKFYPLYIPPALEGKEYTPEQRLREVELYLSMLCKEGIASRYDAKRLARVKEKYPDSDPLAVIEQRLAHELEIIISKGMSDYLLIVYDFIAWAKKRNIPMGPGRGSGVGSIILYLIGITDIEPLGFNLFFERFINPERISYPDIDVDICMDRRAEVIEYVTQKYGKDKVAQIITFGTMKAKMAIKDVGRVLSIPLPKVNKIAKLVPEELNMTIDKALSIDPELKELYESDEEVKRVLSIAKKLEGSVRSTGTHAAGIIICGDPLTEHIPLCVAKDSSMAVTQFSMKPVEAVGMLKIDFLGLKTLTSIQKAVDAIQEKEGIVLDWPNLALDDKETFDFLSQGKTFGIFQLESSGMQDLVQKLKVDRFEEIIAVCALYRPGPMEMIPSFVQRKQGREVIENDHPWMADILSETYGIMVYQEQVMQIASRLAGYSLGEGDVLRRAMGKKDHEEMSKQREKFKQGAIHLGIHEKIAVRIFDKVEKFASYGFNKSHAAAYGYLSYVTAYLKSKYPMEWMAALMTSDRDDISKLSRMIRESQSMSIVILPPDINESGKEFKAVGGGIRFALSGIKGVGEGVVDILLEERKKNGPFTYLQDFLKRCDIRKIGKKTVEHLIESGAFDCTKVPRYQLLHNLEPLYNECMKAQKEKERGVLTFFSLTEEVSSRAIENLEDVAAPPLLHTLRREKELLGFYLTGHPLDEHRPFIEKLSCTELVHAEEMEHDAVIRAALIIENIQIKLASRSNRKFAILTISDGAEHYELPIWPDLYQAKTSIFYEGNLLYAILQIDKKDAALKFSCKWVEPLTAMTNELTQLADATYDRAKGQGKPASFGARDKKNKLSAPKEENTEPWKLPLNLDKVTLSQILQVKQIFREAQGTQPVRMEFFSQGVLKATIHIDKAWGISLSPEVERRIKNIPSVIHDLVQ